MKPGRKVFIKVLNTYVSETHLKAHVVDEARYEGCVVDEDENGYLVLLSTPPKGRNPYKFILVETLVKQVNQAMQEMGNAHLVQFATRNEVAQSLHNEQQARWDKATRERKLAHEVE